MAKVFNNNEKTCLLEVFATVNKGLLAYFKPECVGLSQESFEYWNLIAINWPKIIPLVLNPNNTSIGSNLSLKLFQLFLIGDR